MLPLTRVVGSYDFWLRRVAVPFWEVEVSACCVCGLRVSLRNCDGELAFSSEFQRTVVLVCAVVAIVISESALTLSYVLIMCLLL